ncbi:CPBP family intramembrane metalloprotease [Aquimarina sp. AD10]|uniref:CAAX protease n=1 Tax=Aquimarina aggregata TaxID=1642818 RepID=A0A163CMM7_9FLAO|nr:MULTISPECIES: CPBP family intramembrane glutamic endopeptidase [Aquimarina]AXT59429.1 CPBP family intramembrane metalloprotease [Aquimarina sp. AD10]KZS42573.1 CAAX protease [Aquimarina aggregata]RKN00331.1 CPBP family intramembrane metalloprotease [Aquimarina sp. AD10]
MFIEQGREGKLGMWKYIPIPLGFFALMAFNYLVTTMTDMDTNAAMEQQIDLIGKKGLFLLLLAPFVVFLGGLLFWVKFVHQQSIKSLTTSRKKIDWKRFFFVFGLMAAFIIISIGISYFASPEDFIVNFDPVSFAVLFVMAIILVPIQTSFEEYLFRGYLMQGLGLATKSRAVALIVTSVTFGVMHLGNPEVEMLGPMIMVYYIGTGLFLGIMTLMDEGLELALGFHAANNLITALLVTANWTAFQTDSILVDISDPTESAGYEILFPVFVIFPIFLFILSKKYKWTGWKDKLFGTVKQ